MRTLSLRREALVELSGTDLEHVVGGADRLTVIVCPTVGDTNSLRCAWTFNTCES